MYIKELGNLKDNNFAFCYNRNVDTMVEDTAHKLSYDYVYKNHLLQGPMYFIPSDKHFETFPSMKALDDIFFCVLKFFDVDIKNFKFILGDYGYDVSCEFRYTLDAEYKHRTYGMYHMPNTYVQMAQDMVDVLYLVKKTRDFNLIMEHFDKKKFKNNYLFSLFVKSLLKLPNKELDRIEDWVEKVNRYKGKKYIPYSNECWYLVEEYKKPLPKVSMLSKIVGLEGNRKSLDSLKFPEGIEFNKSELYVKDRNNNIWYMDKKKFKDDYLDELTVAVSALLSNKSCKNCVNCATCVQCNHCTVCDDCERCVSCKFCSDLERCFDCITCVKSQDLSNKRLYQNNTESKNSDLVGRFNLYQYINNRKEIPIE